jgi:SAM-dependent methyltransferase
VGRSIMNIGLLLRTAARAIRERGVLATGARALERLRQREEPDAFDLEYGSDTAGVLPLWTLSIRSDNAACGNRYEPTTKAELVAAVRGLGEDLRQFTFIDLGCGKGRTLMIAAEAGFARVIGVEFAIELVRIARKNLSQPRYAQVDVLHADAAEFDFPDGDLVVYLYNPFDRHVIEAVLANLAKAPSRRLYVLYKTPRCAEVFDQCALLRRLPAPAGAEHIALWGDRRGAG